MVDIRQMVNIITIQMYDIKKINDILWNTSIGASSGCSLSSIPETSEV